MNPIHWKLHWQILLALALATLFACVLMPNIDGGFSSNVEVFCQFIGTLFMNALKMVIVPLIVASIISGVMHLGAEKGVGRMGFKTFLYYTCSGAAAVIVGVVMVNLIGPGNIDAETATAMLGRGSETALNEGLMSKVEGRSSSDLFDIFLRMFPSNIVDAATNNGQLLGVITFSLLFGAFIGKLPETQRETQQKFWESAQEVMLKLTDFIIRFAPFGVFGLVTPVLFNAPIGDLYRRDFLVLRHSSFSSGDSFFHQPRPSAQVYRQGQPDHALQRDGTSAAHCVFHCQFVCHSTADH